MADADAMAGSVHGRLDPENFKVIEAPPTESEVGLVGLNGRDIRSRAFNLLRTRLLKVVNSEKPALVGLTSPSPGDGKSFVSLNLAASLARLSQLPVYLVDLDLRRASLAEQLSIEVDHGIEEYLSGEVSHLNDIGLKLKDHPLVVFPSKIPETSSAEFFTGEGYAKLIHEFRSLTAPSVILFDLPPVFANDDAMLAIEKLDGYILVVRSGLTTRRQVIEASEMLKPSPCIGTILNRFKGSLLDPYGYGSGYYHRYYATS
jgi:protein-tyrosine kinase